MADEQHRGMSEAIYVMKLIVGDIPYEPDVVNKDLTVEEYLRLAATRGKQVLTAGGSEAVATERSIIKLGSGYPLPDCDCDVQPIKKG